METGSVPTAKGPGPGSSADTSKCSSIRSPSPRAPACPTASGPRLLQPRGARASLGPRVRGRRHRPQGEDPGPGPKTVVELWAPRALAALPNSAPLDRGGRPLGLWAPPGPGRRGLAGSGRGGASEEPEVGAAGCASGALGPRV